MQMQMHRVCRSRHPPSRSSIDGLPCFSIQSLSGRHEAIDTSTILDFRIYCIPKEPQRRSILDESMLCFPANIHHSPEPIIHPLPRYWPRPRMTDRATHHAAHAPHFGFGPRLFFSPLRHPCRWDIPHRQEGREGASDFPRPETLFENEIKSHEAELHSMCPFPFRKTCRLFPNHQKI